MSWRKRCGLVAGANYQDLGHFAEGGNVVPGEYPPLQHALDPDLTGGRGPGAKLGFGHGPGKDIVQQGGTRQQRRERAPAAR